MSIQKIAKNVKKSSLKLSEITEVQRSQALCAIAQELRKNKDHLIKENQKDLKRAGKLSQAMVDRLTLTEARIEAMAVSCEQIARAPQVVFLEVESYQRQDDLKIKRIRIPLGVIAMVFESRPNVVIEAMALAIKSANALILKGGKEASFTNSVLFRLAQRATSPFLPSQAFAMIETRSQVAQLLKLSNEIDLVIPRGRSALVEYVKKNATMPVIAHDKGLCHIFVDQDATHAKEIVLNAKTKRPGVCNALETLLIHRHYPLQKLRELIEALLDAGVTIYADPQAKKLFPKLKNATKKSYFTEYLDLKLSLKIVHDVQEAVQHIQIHGSHHTEAILSHNEKNISYFQTYLDASCIVVNASTRFNDGGELGLGAEIGISTQKLHAYGPMGARELTTTRFLVFGNDHIRK